MLGWLQGSRADGAFDPATVAYVSVLLRGTPEGGGGYRKAVAKELPNTEDTQVTMNEPDPCLPLILPPRYRLRDLILGDYAFNDDGER
ncbi:hypothetical protein KM043_013504 [Ampulex compressa]|nr:hypothetical protein KM043_013504 [Ampulex compressa]